MGMGGFDYASLRSRFEEDCDVGPQGGGGRVVSLSNTGPEFQTGTDTLARNPHNHTGVSSLQETATSYLDSTSTALATQATATAISLRTGGAVPSSLVNSVTQSV